MERSTEFAMEQMLSVFDRILERCVPVCVDGPSLREINARENIRMVRAMLDG